jgi:predicted nucleic acid-binding Zn ribbon protein
VTRRPRPLAEVLPVLRTRLAPATILADVQTRWAQVAGEEIAREAQPVSERAGVVTVRCSSAVWASELSMMSTRLLELLNERRPAGAPAVAELRFTMGGRAGGGETD